MSYYNTEDTEDSNTIINKYKYKNHNKFKIPIEGFTNNDDANANTNLNPVLSDYKNIQDIAGNEINSNMVKYDTETTANKFKNIGILTTEEPSVNYVGCYKDTENRAMNWDSKGKIYTDETCKNLAFKNNAKYYALQATDSNGLSECSTSNDIIKTTKYGEIGTYVSVTGWSFSKSSNVIPSSYMSLSKTGDMILMNPLDNSIIIKQSDIVHYNQQPDDCNNNNNNNTNCNSSSYIILQDHGFVIFQTVNGVSKPVFSWGKKMNEIPTDEYKASKGKTGTSRLESGQTLMSGEWIGSEDGSYMLIMNPNGVLSLNYFTGKNLSIGCPIDNIGNRVGSDWANAVFSISPDTSLIGKIGYVDVDGKLNEYPSSLIGYDTTYEKHNGYGVDSKDLGAPPADSVEHCKTYCNSKTNCVGFTYLDNVCNLTSKSFPAVPRIPNINAEYYSRNPQIIGMDKSCVSKDIENVDVSTWNSYPNSGKMMSSNMNCKIDLISPDTQKNLTTKQNTMDTVYNSISKNISNLRGQSSDMYSQINSNNEKTNQNLKKTDELDDKNNNDYNTTTFNRMFSYSDISSIQTKYGYILWSVIVIILIIFIIGIVKKM